jgi:lipopolysaccharide export system permease protein
MHIQQLLAQPLLFMALVLLAAVISIRPSRRHYTLTMIVTGLVIGFVIYFGANFLKALGSSGQIPVLMAAWVPALVPFLIGIGFLSHAEDG